MPEPIEEKTVYGIRPHRPMSEAEADERRRLNLAVEGADSIDRPQADRCACGYCHSCNLQNPDCTCTKPVRFDSRILPETMKPERRLTREQQALFERFEEHVVRNSAPRDRDR